MNYQPLPKSTKADEALAFNKKKSKAQKQKEWNEELDSLMEWSRQNKLITSTAKSSK